MFTACYQPYQLLHTKDGSNSNISGLQYVRGEVDVLDDSKMAHVDTGETSGEIVVFLYGNPTSSYLWRDVIPHVARKSRCKAPDLIGMGHSGKPSIIYRFPDHWLYVAASLEVIVHDGNIVLFIQDWGSALGPDWATRHQSRVSGLAMMDFLAPGLSRTVLRLNCVQFHGYFRKRLLSELFVR